MQNIFFSIKLREKLARCTIRIWCVADLKDKFKLDCLLKTFILWDFKDKLILLI